MITDKDKEELRELTRQIRSTKMDVVFFDYGWNECAEIIMRYVNKKCTESADQARKEAAEMYNKLFEFTKGLLSGTDDYTFSKVVALSELYKITSDTIKEWGRNDKN